MSVPKQRLLDLLKVQTRIFSQTYNPERLRTGNSVLRQRLRGPSVAAYYPRRTLTFKDLRKTYQKLPGVQWEMWDEAEQARLKHNNRIRSKGKGAPKKKRTKEESKSNKMKKKAPVAPQTTDWGKGPSPAAL